eukprot:COSAG01_NODE_67_length_29188_cov_1135.609474_2_plen_168_part_00
MPDTMEEEDAAPVVRILYAPPFHIPACTSLHHNSPHCSHLHTNTHSPSRPTRTLAAHRADRHEHGRPRDSSRTQRVSAQEGLHRYFQPKPKEPLLQDGRGRGGGGGYFSGRGASQHEHEHEHEHEYNNDEDMSTTTTKRQRRCGPRRSALSTLLDDILRGVTMRKGL